MPIAYIYPPGSSTRRSWSGSVVAFRNYPSDRQAAIVDAIDKLNPVDRAVARKTIKLGNNSNAAERKMLAFMQEGGGNDTMASKRQTAEVPIVACVLAAKRRDICTICLNEMDDPSLMAVATACKHVFCRSCILQWVAKQRRCPICRASTHHSLVHLGERDIHIALEILAPSGTVPPSAESQSSIWGKSVLSTIHREQRVVRVIDLVDD